MQTTNLWLDDLLYLLSCIPNTQRLTCLTKRRTKWITAYHPDTCGRVRRHSKCFKKVCARDRRLCVRVRPSVHRSPHVVLKGFVGINTHVCMHTHARTHAEELKSCSVQLELCWMSLNMCYPQSKSTSVYIWRHDSLRKKSAGCHCVHNYHHDNPSGTHQKSTKRSTHLYFTKPSIRCFPTVTAYQSVMLSVTCIIQLQWTKHAIGLDGIKIFLHKPPHVNRSQLCLMEQAT